MVLPNFQPPVGFQPLFVPTPSCDPQPDSVAMAAGRDRACDDALSFGVTGYSRAELLDHADRLVADGEPLGDRILPFENVDVGAADRRRRDLDQGIQCTDIGDRLLIEYNATGSNEDCSFHLWHDGFDGWNRGVASAGRL
jgi:hypothetical protein